MNRKSLLLSAAAVLLVLSGLEHYLQAQPVEFRLRAGAESLRNNAELFDAGTDREFCLQDCRERFGPWAGGGDDPRGRLYARCVQDCENQFWQDYDRRMRDLEQEE
jgi:hypothetical protein